jgi:hypothetical protein
MRQRTFAAACAVAAAAIALAGCDGDGKSGVSGVAATVSATPTTAATTTAVTGRLPELTGMPLLAARGIAGDAGFTQVSAHDATGTGRAQVSDGDWKVCFQEPGPGPAALADPVALAVVKIAEICPAADGTPAPSPTVSPSPTASPTRTPKPAVTTHRATPRPRPTTAPPTHRATPKPRRTAPHTEPPVDDHDGATALCNDGTLSYSAHHRGTCSHHHGVAVWYK